MTSIPRTLADVDRQLKDNENFFGCKDATDRAAVTIFDQLWAQLVSNLAPQIGQHEVSCERDKAQSADSRPVGKYLVRHSVGTPISYTFVARIRIPAHDFESATTLDLVAHPSNATDGTTTLIDWKFAAAAIGITDLGIGVPAKEPLARAAKLAATLICNDAFKKAELGKTESS